VIGSVAPRVEVVDDDAALARIAADHVEKVVRSDPGAIVVPATGETPLGLYAELASRRAAGRLDPSGLTIVQLDDYLGLATTDRRSLFGWMDRTLLRPLGIAAAQVRRLPTDGDGAACIAVDEELERRGGIDLAILGLGANGHLGFNEPGSPADSATRVVELLPGTIEANARYWGSVADVPTRAVTLGLRTLLAARSILLLVSGERKHDVLHRALEGAVGDDVPASFLQRVRGEVTLIVDRAAWGS
jgi:glucosamine-6-phosphate deaminase